MKKLLGFASLLLIALLTACNADNLDEIVEAGKGDVLSEADRVPVQLSISPASNTTDMTRAPLASGTTPNHNFTTPDGQYLGIFALAQTNTPAGNITGPVSTENIRWDGSVERARLLWNQPAKADSTNQWQGQVLQDYYTAIHLLDPASLSTTPTEVFPSYPLSSWYNYYFYAYYPRVADNSIHESNNVVTADYTLDGSQDIITGIAKPATNPNNGYCGKYFRSIRVSGDGSLQLGQIPQLELNHHLAQLRFYVRTKDIVVPTLQVKEITLKDVPSEWSLTIADKSNPNNNGTLTSRSAIKVDIPVRPMDDSEFTSVTLTGTTPRLAGYAMIPTTAMVTAANQTPLNRNFSTSYEVDVTVILTTGEEVTFTKTITPTTSFDSSKVYNIIVKIDQYSIEEFDVDPRAVDLDLPSGTKWARMNVGATDETDLGETGKEYFAWGEINGHSTDTYDGYHFTWDNTPYHDPNSPGGDEQYFTKYPPGTVLEAMDDAVAVHMGTTWRMPTNADFQELLNNTNHQWVSNYNNTGVKGMLFTSKTNSEKFIFMPVAGYRYTTGSGSKMRDKIYQKDNYGYYWSSTVSSSDNKMASCLRFTSENSTSRPTINRCNGLLIRGVLPKKTRN